ncbi:MAG TPA: FG-GAP repeat protein [Polyangia bacterium]|nr:FG-GAP repeat protein [Polyangia bacterium]
MARTIALAALALGAATCAQPAGLVVDVDLGSFQSSAAEVRVILHAPHGFMRATQADDVTGPGVTQEDVDGDGTLDLVIRFIAIPSSGKEHFLVSTKNDAAIDIHGEAVAFDSMKIIANATGDATLPGGGRATLALALAAASPGTVGPGTRSTDLLTASADATIKAPASTAGVTSVAACAFDGDGKKNDLVVGVASLDRDASRTQAGAVFVVFDVSGAVTLDPHDASQLVFYGDMAGDHLGASVACADLNGDPFDDLIVGAPNAENGAGRVYAVYGKQAFNRRAVDVGTNATMSERADALWGPVVVAPATATASGHFGSPLFAFADGAGKTRVLAAEPDAKKVHLLPAAAAAGAVTDVSLPDHPVFTGVTATSLAAGDFDDMKTGVDVVVGDPSYIPMNQVAASGAVFVFANVDPAGVAATAATAATTTIVGDGNGFGRAALALDSTGRGQDLLVSQPSGGDGRGLVYLYAHDGDFFHAPMRDFKATQKKGSPLDLGDANAGFGGALAACANGTGATATYGLAVGAPGTTRVASRSNAGGAYVLATGGGFTILERLYGANANDRLGSAVACGDFNGDGRGDLVTIAPAAMGVATGSGVAYVLYTHAQ